MAALRERPEEAPLVGLEEAVTEADRQFSWPLQRSRIVKASALALLVAVGLLVMAVAMSGTTHRMLPADKADPEGFTRLDVLHGGRIDLQVATSSQAYAETASSVSVAFMVGGVWTPDQELFPSAEEGQVNTVSAMVSDQPTAVRLRINGNDGWGYKFVRMSYGGVTRSLLESLNGEPYGDNEYWLDGDQDLQKERIFSVPKIAKRKSGRNNIASRLLTFLLLLAIVAAVVAYIFREHIRRLLPGGNQVSQLQGQMPVQPALVSRQGLLGTTASVPSVQNFESKPMVQ